MFVSCAALGTVWQPARSRPKIPNMTNNLFLITTPPLHMFVLQDNISIIIIDKLMTVCHKVFLTFIFTILTVLIPALLYTCFSEIIKPDKQKPIMKGIFNMKK